MLLGFDALGRYGLLQFPALRSAALVAMQGTFAETGQAATLKLSQSAAVGPLALAGVSVAFNARQSVALGALTIAGVPTTFRSTALATPGGYATSSPGGACGIKLPTPVGSYSIVGSSSSFGNFSAAASCAYVVSTSNVAFGRDFEAWFPRPFDLDDWAVPALENKAWLATPRVPFDWSLQFKQSASWTPADKQSETWSLE